jgi:formate/nitrite transporter FocA (FNT family)
MTQALIDTAALLKLLYSSLLAGVSVAVVFSLAILGATRSSDMRRDGRSLAAGAYAALSIVSLVLAAAIVVYGLVLMARKS